MKARRTRPGSSRGAISMSRVQASASLVSPRTPTDEAYRSSVPSRAKPIPIEPRIRYFQAASIAAGVRAKPTSSADTIVVASIADPHEPQVVEERDGRQAGREPQQERVVAARRRAAAASGRQLVRQVARRPGERDRGDRRGRGPACTRRGRRPRPGRRRHAPARRRTRAREGEPGQAIDGPRPATASRCARRASANQAARPASGRSDDGQDDEQLDHPRRLRS